MKSWIMRVLVLAMLLVCVAPFGRAQESHPSSNPNVAPSESKLAAHPAESRTEAEETPGSPRRSRRVVGRQRTRLGHDDDEILQRDCQRGRSSLRKRRSLAG